MLIIAEKINATRSAVRQALADRDEKTILALAQSQLDAGADLLDVNGGDPDPAAEMENMQWLIATIGGEFDARLCVDSSNPDVLAAGLEQAGPGAILNSVSLEQGRLEPLAALAAQRGCEVIALCMDDAGVPAGVDDRVERAARLIERLADAGVGADRVIVDPCFFPVSSDPSAVRTVCEAIARIRALDPAVRVGGGVSNSSFGLPQRRWINHAVLTAAIFAGMNVGIVDPAAPGAMATIRAAEAACGADEFCGRYLGAYREGALS